MVEYFCSNFLFSFLDDHMFLSFLLFVGAFVKKKLSHTKQCVQSSNANLCNAPKVQLLYGSVLLFSAFVSLSMLSSVLLSLVPFFKKDHSLLFIGDFCFVSPIFYPYLSLPELIISPKVSCSFPCHFFPLLYEESGCGLIFHHVYEFWKTVCSIFRLHLRSNAVVANLQFWLSVQRTFAPLNSCVFFKHRFHTRSSLDYLTFTPQTIPVFVNPVHIDKVYVNKTEWEILSS